MDTELVNSDVTSTNGGTMCNQDSTVVSNACCSDETLLTERVTAPNREEKTVMSNEIKVNVSQTDAAATGSKRRHPGRVVAGAIGGVLLCSAAAYYAANAAGYTPRTGASYVAPEDNVADDVAEEAKTNNADLSQTQLSDTETEGAKVESDALADVDVQADVNADALVDDAQFEGDDALGGPDSADIQGDDVVHDMSDDDIVDTAVDFAEGVNDDMSFNEAFAAARAEVGAGGAFEWRGQIYGTYYADEWEAMSDDEKDAFGDKFDFGGADSDYEAEATADDDVVVEDDEIEIVVDDDADDDYDDEVEFLGVVNDDGELDISFASDDEAVVFIDIVSDDDDMDFDNNSFDMGDDMVASTDDFDNDIDVDGDGGFFA